MLDNKTQPDWIDQALNTQRHWQHRHHLASAFSDAVPTSGDVLNTLLEPAAQCIKHDRTTTVKRISGGGHQLICKRYNARSLWHRIKRALRRSRAERCWQMSYRFAGAGLRVARPVLMLEQRFGPLCGDAWFVSSYLDGEELLKSLPHMPAPEQQQVAVAVSQAFRIMREHRLAHGDMKASNLLWVDGELVFIDLDAANWFSDTWLGRRLWQRAHGRDLRRWRKNWRNQPALRELFTDR